jgi:hypothetical protein
LLDDQIEIFNPRQAHLTKPKDLGEVRPTSVVLDDQLEIFNPRQAHHTKPKRYTSG